MRKLKTLQVAMGRNVRALREAAGLTQRELGERLDCQHGYVGRLEHGGGNPTLRYLVKLAGALRCSVSDLLNGT